MQQHGHALGLLVGHVLARHLGNRGRVAGCGGLLAVANGLAQLNLHRQAGGELGEPLSRRLLGFGLAIALAEAELACILVFDGGHELDHAGALCRGHLAGAHQALHHATQALGLALFAQCGQLGVLGFTGAGELGQLLFGDALRLLRCGQRVLLLLTHRLGSFRVGRKIGGGRIGFVLVIGTRLCGRFVDGVDLPLRQHLVSALDAFLFNQPVAQAAQALAGRLQAPHQAVARAGKLVAVILRGRKLQRLEAINGRRHRAQKAHMPNAPAVRVVLEHAQAAVAIGAGRYRVAECGVHVGEPGKQLVALALVAIGPAIGRVVVPGVAQHNGCGPQGMVGRHLVQVSLAELALAALAVGMGARAEHLNPAREGLFGLLGGAGGRRGRCGLRHAPHCADGGRFRRGEVDHRPPETGKPALR